MRLNNADVVKKLIFRYLSVPLTNGIANIFINKINKNDLDILIELNKFLSNVCIIRFNPYKPAIPACIFAA